MTAIKWAGKSRDVIEGLLAPYGGPEFLAGKDFQGEFFSSNTDFALDWFGDWQRPLLFQHGLDPNLDTSVVGRIKVALRDKGLWMRAQLDKAHDYYEEIATLVDEAALGLSSGSMPHLVKVDAKTGEIKSWPLIEGSLTPTPANPDAKAGYSIKSEEAIAHLAVIGVEAPDALKADEPEEDDDEEEEEDGSEPTLGFDGTKDDDTVGVEDDATKMSMTRHEMMQMTLGAITGALTPQALHDAAKASGAACEPMGEMAGKTEPAPLLAIAGKSAEPEPAVDLDALQARLSAKAVAVAKELLGH